MEILRRPCDTPAVTLLDPDGGLEHTTTAEFVHRLNPTDAIPDAKFVDAGPPTIYC